MDRYRRKGPWSTTRLLIDTVRAQGIEGMTLLDIGGGVGAIQHELLTNGASTATSVDASGAYIQAAKKESERRGLTDRAAYHQGNFVDLAPQIDPADIVTLDRVICCYHDMEALVGLSAARARKLYGLVYPRDTWWMRLGFAGLNLAMWALRNPFRGFVHPTRAVDAVVGSNGLERHSYRRTALWQVALYARQASTGGRRGEAAY